MVSRELTWICQAPLLSPVVTYWSLKRKDRFISGFTPLTDLVLFTDIMTLSLDSISLWYLQRYCLIRYQYLTSYHIPESDLPWTFKSMLTHSDMHMRHFTYNGIRSFRILSPSVWGPNSTLLFVILPRYYTYSSDNDPQCNYDISKYCPFRIAIHEWGWRTKSGIALKEKYYT